MLDAIARALGDCRAIGQIAIRKLENGGFAIFHSEDETHDRLEIFDSAEAAIALSKFDDAGNYRPLKTAPNLRHGWRLELADLTELARAIDYFYPARLSIFCAWKGDRLKTTPLRETLDRQSGMYRIAAKISDEQINETVANFCRSDGGCLRTILWKRDTSGEIPSRKLPADKYDPGSTTEATIPLVCQEACSLLVNECRKVVKGESRTDGFPAVD